MVCLPQQTQNSLLPNRLRCVWKHWLAGKLQSICHWFCWFSFAKSQSYKSFPLFSQSLCEAQANGYRATVDFSVLLCPALGCISSVNTNDRRAGRRRCITAHTAIFLGKGSAVWIVGQCTCIQLWHCKVHSTCRRSLKRGLYVDVCG